MSENKIWWITPIVIVMGLVGWLVLSDDANDGDNSHADPFIYDTN